MVGKVRIFTLTIRKMLIIRNTSVLQDIRTQVCEVSRFTTRHNESKKL
jgi:hypothetical protein